MQKLCRLIMITGLLFACSPQNPVSDSVPIPSESTNKEEVASFDALGELSLKLDLSKLSAETQALLKEEYFTIRAELIDSPSPVAAPSSVSASSDLMVQPNWGPLKMQTNQALALKHIPIKKKITVNASLTYAIKEADLVNCGETERAFVAQESFSLSELQQSERVLNVTEIKNTDIGSSSCDVYLGGTVLSADQQVVENATVRFRSLNTSVPYKSSAQTDSKGNYVLNNAPFGIQLEITVEAAGYNSSTRTEVIKTNRQEDPKVNRFDFTLAPSSQVFKLILLHAVCKAECPI